MGSPERIAVAKPIWRKRQPYTGDHLERFFPTGWNRDFQNRQSNDHQPGGERIYDDRVHCWMLKPFSVRFEEDVQVYIARTNFEGTFSGYETSDSYYKYELLGEVSILVASRLSTVLLKTVSGQPLLILETTKPFRNHDYLR